MNWPSQLNDARSRPVLDDMNAGYATDRAAFRQAMTSRFGSRAIVNPHDLIAYSYDATGERCRPDAVLLADSADEVAAAVQIARTHRVPVIGRGSGSNISGGTVPVFGGLVIALARMKRIVATDWDRRLVTVEPGVINAELQRHLATRRFFFPPDPASHRIATLGGNVAEASGGPHCVKYGVTPHYIRGLDGVLATGEAVTFPRAGDVVDWNGLLTGSEGTLAILTRLTLGFSPLPQATRTLLAGFADLPTAVRAVSAIIAAQIVPSTLELLDRAALAAVRPFIDAGYPASLDAVLLIEVDGPEALLPSQVDRLQTVLSGHQVAYLDLAEDAKQADRLMAARRAAYGAVARLGSHIWVQDVTVPRPKLAEMMEYVLAIRDTYRLAMASLAHVGDGNLHPLIPYNAEDPEEWQRMLQADRLILEKAAQLGGSITGEHGIGVDKLERLPLMYSADELRGMYSVKQAFDPDGWLNPGKAVYPVPRDPADPVSAEKPDALHDLVRWARSHHTRLVVRGAGLRCPPPPHLGQVVGMTDRRRVIGFDPDNLTIEVESGLSLAALAEILAPHRLFFPGSGTLPEETVGGLLSVGATPLRAFGWGPLKNWVLGVTVVDGRGRTLHYGRPVVKNVAGLDMPKLFLGSLGAFGVVTRAILRLWPQPPEQAVGTLTADYLPPAAMRKLAQALAADPLRPTAVFAQKRPNQPPRVHVVIEDWDAMAVAQHVERLAAHEAPGCWDWTWGAMGTFLTTLAADRRGAWQRAREPGLSQALVTEGDAPLTMPTHPQAEWLWHPAQGVASVTVAGSDALGLAPGRVMTPNGWCLVPETAAYKPLIPIRRRLKDAFDPDHVFGGDWRDSLWD
ncbi:MAG: FAD-binding protein [Thermaerobacter sp.]|nr:FAD-binding protein [Thermaerobacter sp.]